MSYQVLARKWRPRTFTEMVGQEPILQMLTHALNTERLHHAYLFTGTRGVGKTTLARILAKCLNCETGVTSTPCETCSICQAVDAGRFLDLLEIDAASRTKVEDTRELLDNVQYAPSQGRYKIYLIDEVHMLSNHSFNALLKTLEEPPAHVKFLLATTDPQRLPITILSRCLQFNLKRVPVEQIETQLAHICSAEKIPYEAPALTQLSHAADGSMRDALSLLDQAIAYCHEDVKAEGVRLMLGHVEQDYIDRLLNALADQDGKALLNEVTRLSEQAPDFNQVLIALLTNLHNIALTQMVAAPNGATTAIIELANRFSAEEVQLYYQIALTGRRDLPQAASPKQGFEMLMLRMLAFKPSDVQTTAVTTKTAIMANTNRMTTSSTSKPAGNHTATKPATNTHAYTSTVATESGVARTNATNTAHAAKNTETNTSNTSVAHAANTNKASTSNTTKTSIPATDEWTLLLNQLGLTGMAYALASNCALSAITDQTIELVLSTKHEPMLNKKLADRLEETLSAHFKRPLTLNIKISNGELNTSAKQQEHIKKTKRDIALDTLNQDSHVQKILNVFDATLDLNSVKAIDTPETTGGE